MLTRIMLLLVNNPAEIDSVAQHRVESAASERDAGPVPPRDAPPNLAQNAADREIV
jgi:hypothetical protein